MFDEFNELHDNRQSDSIPYFSFYDLNGNLITGSIQVSFTDNGQFDTLLVQNDGQEVSYNKDEYTYTTECLYVLGIGFLIPGDIVKLKITDTKTYELNWGWHTNVSGQQIYSWYLVPQQEPDYFYDTRKGFMQTVDLATTNINSKGILTFYKEYLKTIEVVQFRKDRVYFDKQ